MRRCHNSSGEPGCSGITGVIYARLRASLVRVTSSFRQTAFLFSPHFSVASTAKGSRARALDVTSRSQLPSLAVVKRGCLDLDPLLRHEDRQLRPGRLRQDADAHKGGSRAPPTGIVELRR